MRTVKLTWFIVAAMVLSACAQATPPPVVIRIDMTEFAFTPSALELRVGQQVTIELVNLGALAHELMMGRDVKMTNGRPDGYLNGPFELAGIEPEVHGGQMGEMFGHGMEHSGFMVTVPVGNDMATLTFTVTKAMIGEWEIGCFAQDGVHYNAGMKGTLVVLP